MNEAKQKVVMPTSKQPGQIAFEAHCSALFHEIAVEFGDLPGATAKRWAAVESAVRADERAKIQAELEALRKDKELLDGLEREIKKEPLLLHNCASFLDLPRQNRGLGLLPHNPRSLREALKSFLGNVQPQPVAAILDAAQDPDGGEQ